MRCLLLLPAVLVASNAVAEPKINAHEVKCLATTVYGEARGESTYGKLAVAWTLINRAVGKTVCKVALEHVDVAGTTKPTTYYQYSVYNDNPALQAAATSLNINPPKMNIIETIAWHESLEIAKAVLEKRIDDPTNGATHYVSPVAMKAQKLVWPEWTRSWNFKMVASIENHRFYKRVEHKVDPKVIEAYLHFPTICDKWLDRDPFVRYNVLY